MVFIDLLQKTTKKHMFLMLFWSRTYKNNRKHNDFVDFWHQKAKNMLFLVGFMQKSKKTNGFRWFPQPKTVNYKADEEPGRSTPGQGLGGWPHNFFFFLRLSPAGGAGPGPDSAQALRICMQKHYIIDKQL